MSGGMELYLHIPFCVKKCAYCDFLSFPSGQELQRQYAKRLMEDIDCMGKKYGDIPVDTIFIGGGTGSALRYFIQLLMHERIVPYHFPWATFTVNLLGSFLIGLFYALSERFPLPFEVRLFLTTGLCGGFTTFSTFSSDGVGLLKGEFYGAFVLYTLLSIGIGLAATLAGGYVGKQI